jgi:hypothetical protein
VDEYQKSIVAVLFGFTLLTGAYVLTEWHGALLGLAAFVTTILLAAAGVLQVCARSDRDCLHPACFNADPLPVSSRPAPARPNGASIGQGGDESISGRIWIESSTRDLVGQLAGSGAASNRAESAADSLHG